MQLLPNSEEKANSYGTEEFAHILRIRPGPLASSLQIEAGKPEARGGGRMDGVCVSGTIYFG